MGWWNKHRARGEALGNASTRFTYAKERSIRCHVSLVLLTIHSLRPVCRLDCGARGTMTRVIDRMRNLYQRIFAGALLGLK